MDLQDLTIRINDPLLRAAREVARARDVSLGQLIRDALATEVARAPQSEIARSGG
ncbi:MAG: ribbon-helix-helix protein, CopG family [Rhodobacteraceae bacterium]|nr:ribbon-helix-helix protein, CopG family [Paracoccaceae bacterium]